MTESGHDVQRKLSLNTQNLDLCSSATNPPTSATTANTMECTPSFMTTRKLRSGADRSESSASRRAATPKGYLSFQTVRRPRAVRGHESTISTDAVRKSRRRIIPSCSCSDCEEYTSIFGAIHKQPQEHSRSYAGSSVGRSTVETRAASPADMEHDEKETENSLRRTHRAGRRPILRPATRRGLLPVTIPTCPAASSPFLGTLVFNSLAVGTVPFGFRYTNENLEERSRKDGESKRQGAPRGRGSFRLGRRPQHVEKTPTYSSETQVSDLIETYSDAPSISSSMFDERGNCRSRSTRTSRYSRPSGSSPSRGTPAPFRLLPKKANPSGTKRRSSALKLFHFSSQSASRDENQYQRAKQSSPTRTIKSITLQDEGASSACESVSDKSSTIVRNSAVIEGPFDESALGIDQFPPADWQQENMQAPALPVVETTEAQSTVSYVPGPPECAMPVEDREKNGTAKQVFRTPTFSFGMRRRMRGSERGASALHSLGLNRGPKQADSQSLQEDITSNHSGKSLTPGPSFASGLFMTCTSSACHKNSTSAPPTSAWPSLVCNSPSGTIGIRRSSTVLQTAKRRIQSVPTQLLHSLRQSSLTGPHAKCFKRVPPQFESPEAPQRKNITTIENTRGKNSANQIRKSEPSFSTQVASDGKYRVLHITEGRKGAPSIASMQSTQNLARKRESQPESTSTDPDADARKLGALDSPFSGGDHWEDPDIPGPCQMSTSRESPTVGELMRSASTSKGKSKGKASPGPRNLGSLRSNVTDEMIIEEDEDRLVSPSQTPPPVPAIPPALFIQSRTPTSAHRRSPLPASFQRLRGCCGQVQHHLLRVVESARVSAEGLPSLQGAGEGQRAGKLTASESISSAGSPSSLHSHSTATTATPRGAVVPPAPPISSCPSPISPSSTLTPTLSEGLETMDIAAEFPASDQSAELVWTSSSNSFNSSSSSVLTGSPSDRKRMAGSRISRPSPFSPVGRSSSLKQASASWPVSRRSAPQNVVISGKTPRNTSAFSATGQGDRSSMSTNGSVVPVTNTDQSEIWDNDFELDGDPRSGILVPSELQAAQDTIKQDLSNVREFALQIDDLKQLYSQVQVETRRIAVAHSGRVAEVASCYERDFEETKVLIELGDREDAVFPYLSVNESYSGMGDSAWEETDMSFSSALSGPCEPSRNSDVLKGIIAGLGSACPGVSANLSAAAASSVSSTSVHCSADKRLRRQHSSIHPRKQIRPRKRQDYARDDGKRILQFSPEMMPRVLEHMRALKERLGIYLVTLVALDDDANDEDAGFDDWGRAQRKSMTHLKERIHSEGPVVSTASCRVARPTDVKSPGSHLLSLPRSTQRS